MIGEDEEKTAPQTTSTFLYLNSSTVRIYASIDSLRGGQGLDWFFATFLEDIIADLNRGGLETVNYL